MGTQILEIAKKCSAEIELKSKNQKYWPDKDKEKRLTLQMSQKKNSEKNCTGNK